MSAIPTMQEELIKKETNEAYLDALIEGILDKIPYTVRVRKNYRTACWTFRNGRHYIFVGDALHRMLGRALQRGDEEYIHSFFQHELGHSLFTERDLRSLDQALKSEGIPFRLYNLFEDARIEERMRQITGRLFGWSRFEKIGVSDKPGALLFAIIQQDGDTTGLEDSAIFERVYDYYMRAVSASDSWALIPIIKEWLEEFGAKSAETLKEDIREAQEAAGDENEDGSSEQEDGESVGQTDEGNQESNDSEETDPDVGNESEEDDGDAEPETDADQELADEGAETEPSEEENDTPLNLEDLQLSMEMQEDDEAFDAGMDESEDIESLEALSGGKPLSDEDCIETGTVVISECSNGTVRVEGRFVDWDREEAKRLTGEFKKLFRGRKVMQNTRRPTRRLNLRDLSIGKFDQPFREKNMTAKETKRVCIIVDCSRSMEKIMPDMKVVLDIFSRLAESGHVEGHVVLSGVHRSIAKAETLKLPLSIGTIGEIDGIYGAEGLDNAFRMATPLMREADWNIVLTDGRINDNCIDRNYYRSIGIRTYGIYIGDEDYADLSRWFDYQIIEPGPKQIADKMLRLLK